MEKFLTWFIYGWGGLILILNVLAIIGMFMVTETFWDGWQRMNDTYSPFNIVNFLTEMIALSPIFGAYYWREKIRQKTSKTS